MKHMTLILVLLGPCVLACAPPTPPLLPPISPTPLASGTGAVVGFHRMEPSGGADALLIVVTETGAVGVTPDGTMLPRTISTARELYGSEVAGRTLVLSEGDRTTSVLTLWDDTLAPTGLETIELRAYCRGIYVVRGDDVGCWASGLHLSPTVIDLPTGTEAPGPGVGPPDKMIGGYAEPSHVIPGRDAVLLGSGLLYWADLETMRVMGDRVDSGPGRLEAPLAFVGPRGAGVVVGSDGLAYGFEGCFAPERTMVSCRDPLGPFFALREGMEIVATAPSRADALYALESASGGGFCEGEGCRVIHADPSGRIVAHTAFLLPSTERAFHVLQADPGRGVAYVLAEACTTGVCTEWSIYEIPLP